MTAPSGENGLARRTLAVATALAFGLCLLAVGFAPLNAAFTGWGPLAGAPSCLGASGPGALDALTVHLASLLRYFARACVGLSAFTTIFVAGPLIAQPHIVTPGAAAEVPLLGPVPLAAGWLGALVPTLVPTIGGC